MEQYVCWAQIVITISSETVVIFFSSLLQQCAACFHYDFLLGKQL